MMSMHTIPPLYKLAMAGSVEEGISPHAHRGSDNGPTEGRRKGGPIDFPGNFLANQSPLLSIVVVASRFSLPEGTMK